MAPRIRSSRCLAVLTLTPLLVGGLLTGCTVGGVTDPQELDAINTGVNAEVGPLSADNLLVITAAEGEPGRLLGSLGSSADASLEVRFADDDEEIVITLPPEDGVMFELDQHSHIFQSTAAAPGALAPVTVTADGQSEELQVPVFDGSLEPYREFLPGN